MDSGFRRTSNSPRLEPVCINPQKEQTPCEGQEFSSIWGCGLPTSLFCDPLTPVPRAPLWLQWPSSSLCPWGCHYCSDMGLQCFLLTVCPTGVWWDKGIRTSCWNSTSMGEQVKETPKMAFLIYVGNPPPKPTSKQEELCVPYMYKCKKDQRHSSPDYTMRSNITDQTQTATRLKDNIIVLARIVYKQQHNISHLWQNIG